MERSNPREFIGANGPPDDEEEPPTLEEARKIAEAAAYIQFRFPDLKNVLAKRKGKTEMGFRKVLTHILKPEVRLHALHVILMMNRKTIGEDQQRPIIWSDLDDEFDAQLEHVREAVIRHISIDPGKFTSRLDYWVGKDPELRDLEKLQRQAELAALRAEQAAADIKERGRLSKVAELKKTLGRSHLAQRVEAEHLGPSSLSERISDEAIAVIEILVKREVKGQRPPASELNAKGLAECKRLGLARCAEPHLSKAIDPKWGPTGLCAKVFEAALASGRIAKPKKSKPASA